MDARLLSHRIDPPEGANSCMDPHRIPYQRLELNSVKHKELQDKLLNSTRSRHIWKTDRVFPVKPIPVKTCSVIENYFASHFEPCPHSYTRFGSLNAAYHVNNQDCIENIHFSSTKPHETHLNVSDCNLIGKTRLSDCSNFKKLSNFVSCSDVSRQKNCSVQLQHTEEKSPERNKSEERFFPEQQQMRLIGYRTTENLSMNCSNKIDRPTAQNHQVDIETSDKLYQCNVCNRRFRRSDNLRQHRLIHTGEKPYQCDVCNKRFRRSFVLNRHRLIHTGEKPYQCDVCNKRYRSRDNLDQHKLIHTDEKSYQCNVCKKRFRFRSTLYHHSRIHIDEKRYPCNVCNKRFRHRSTLNQHRLIHTDEKRYSCNVCNKRFQQSANLSRHKRTHTRKTSS